MPKVSIIVPVYNTEKYLAKCLDSIIMQTLEEIEIICIDDGSTDDSSRILDRYAVADARIKVIHGCNKGCIWSFFTVLCHFYIDPVTVFSNPYLCGIIPTQTLDLLRTFHLRHRLIAIHRAKCRIFFKDHTHTFV